jgi:hypothetical protein
LYKAIVLLGFGVELTGMILLPVVSQSKKKERGRKDLLPN